MAQGFMRGQAKRRELVDAFVAWFVPGEPPPRKNAVRGFATDLLKIAGDEPIADAHLDALVKVYRKRFAGPRTIVDARHVGEQLRRWHEELTGGAATRAGTGDNSPEASATEEPVGPPDGARAGSLAGVGDEVDATPQAALEIDFAAPAPGSPVPRSNTLPGLGRAIAEAKKRPSGKAKRIVGPTLPGIGIAQMLGDPIDGPASRPGIFRGTIPGMGKVVGDDQDDSAAQTTGNEIGGDQPTAPSSEPATTDSQPPGAARAGGPRTQPGVGASADSAAPHANEGMPGRTQVGVRAWSDSDPPGAPRAAGPSDRPRPRLPADGAMRPPAVPAGAAAMAPPSRPPAAPAAARPASVPPGPTPSTPPSAGIPPRPSYRPIIPDPPPSLAARLVETLGINGSPAERMRAKLIGMAIAAILLMLLIMSGRSCLVGERHGAKDTPSYPASPQGK